MPSPSALERGTAAATAILDQHKAVNGSSYPETVAINLWGLDAIKTKGESVAMVLHMVRQHAVCMCVCGAGWGCLLRVGCLFAM